MKVIHENDNYMVALKDDSEKNYSVINKSTLCIEYQHNYLPQSIGVSEQFNYLLVNEVWKEFAVDEDEGFGGMHLVPPTGIN